MAYAPATLLSPFGYSQLVVILVLGFWSSASSRMRFALAGIALIAASGLGLVLASRRPAGAITRIVRALPCREICLESIRVKRCLAILTTFAALALLAGCATSKLVAQKANPDYVGKTLQERDGGGGDGGRDGASHIRGPHGRAPRPSAGIKGIPGYAAVGKRGRVEEAELREAIARSGAEGVLITRVTRIDRSSGTVPGATVAVGVGWGGFYGYYSGVWADGQYSCAEDDRPVVDGLRDALVRREERHACMDRDNGHKRDTTTSMRH